MRLSIKDFKCENKSLTSISRGSWLYYITSDFRLISNLRSLYERILLIFINYMTSVESTELVALTVTVHYEPSNVLFSGIYSNY